MLPSTDLFASALAGVGVPVLVRRVAALLGLGVPAHATALVAQVDLCPVAILPTQMKKIRCHKK